MSESTLGRLPAIVVSSRLTLAGSLLLGAGLVWQQIRPEAGAWAVTLSLLVLGTNLLAALLWDKRLRGHPALFLFHVGLLLIGVLAGWGQLAEFKGRLVLAEGQQFHPSLVETVEHGPMHPSLPQEGRFRQGAVAVDYRAGMHRGRTHSQLRFADGRDVHVGDDIPLLVDGYRFYTTSNKGFAAYLEWTSSDGTVELGVVHLPSYPIREMTQFNRWRTPAGEDLEFSLDLPVIERGQDWRLSRDVARETPLLIRAAGKTWQLAPGERLAMGGGSLCFMDVGLWLGYRVHHDPALPWLFSAALITLATLAWFLVSTWTRERARQASSQQVLRRSWAKAVGL